MGPWSQWVHSGQELCTTCTQWHLRSLCEDQPAMGDWAGLQLGMKADPRVHLGKGAWWGRVPGGARAEAGRPWGSAEHPWPLRGEGTDLASPPPPPLFPRCSFLQKMLDFLLSQSRLWRDSGKIVSWALETPLQDETHKCTRNPVPMRGSRSEQRWREEGRQLVVCWPLYPCHVTGSHCH